MDVEPAENIGYFELLAHDREKAILTSIQITFRPFKWKLEKIFAFNLECTLFKSRRSLRYFLMSQTISIRQFDIVKAVSVRDRKSQTAY